jgi:hypothetical protein
MNFLIEIIFPLFFLCILLAFLVAGGCLAWHSMPERGHATLKQALARVTGRWGNRPHAGQTYAVHVDGQLRYASGQEDVETFLLTTMTVASRQVLRGMTEEQPATLVFTCGPESVVIEVHLSGRSA